MKYVFYNMAGKEIWRCPKEYVEQENPCEEGFETHAAIQLLFKNVGPPPLDTINLVAVEHGTNREEWDVGPFRLIVTKVEDSLGEEY